MYFNNNIFQDATNAALTPLQTGNYYVIVTLNDCSSQPSNIISYNHTGIEETTNSNRIELYPNPTTGIIRVSLNIQFESDYFVEVYNNLGTLIQTIEKEKSETKFNINLSIYPSGFYLLRFFSKSISYHGIVINK